MEDILCGWLTKSPGDKFVTFLKGKVHIPVKAVSMELISLMPTAKVLE